MYIAGTVTLAGTGHEGELADDKNTRVIDTRHRQIHYSVPVVENTHLNNLMTQVVDILVGIAVLYAEKNKQSIAYFAVTAAVDIDSGALNSLYYYSHSSSFLFFKI